MQQFPVIVSLELFRGSLSATRQLNIVYFPSTRECDNWLTGLKMGGGLGVLEGSALGYDGTPLDWQFHQYNLQGLQLPTQIVHKELSVVISHSKLYVFTYCLLNLEMIRISGLASRETIKLGYYKVQILLIFSVLRNERQWHTYISHNIFYI